MQLQVAERRDAATQEIDRLNVIRQAAGVADRVARPAAGRHYGRWVCTDCRRERHVPPYLPFGLGIHRREHERRYPDHKILYYCFDHCAFEDDEDLLTLPQPWDIPELQAVELADVPSTEQSQQVQVALEVLRRAGYLPPAAPALLPPPAPLLFTHGEAAVLKLVRAHPGILAREIAAQRGLARSTITSYLGMLRRGGHVRLELGRWYPVGDRPIGKVESRGKVNWVRRPLGQEFQH